MKLNKYNKGNYNPGNILKISLWLITSRIFFETSFPWSSGMKRTILKSFGAKIGRKVKIKPQVKIKYPWFLSVGDHSWLGEKVWIDNLDFVRIGKNCCISQGSYLCTGNHDYKRETFNLITQPILIEDSVWIAAKSIVSPGVKCKEGSILTIGSVATKNLNKKTIYQGNPAKSIRKRNEGN